jgi:predicted GNAT family acetyltransferase
MRPPGVPALRRKTMTVSVRNDREAHLYDAYVDEKVVGTISYEPIGSRIVLHHSYVHPKFRKQGVASEMVRQALEDVRAGGLKVSALCSFVVDFLNKNEAEYADIVDPAHQGRAMRSMRD